MTYAPTTTTREAKTLHELAANGATLVGAADAMGWDFQRIQYWERRLGLHFKRGGRPLAIHTQDATKLRKLADAGLSLDMAAERMEWDRDKIRYWEKRLGLQFTRMRQRK